LRKAPAAAAVGAKEDVGIHVQACATRAALARQMIDARHGEFNEDLGRIWEREPP
jgi:hypothetical protein